MKYTDRTDNKQNSSDMGDNGRDLIGIHRLAGQLLYEDLCYKIIGCIYDVRNLYGSGQKELVYQNALVEFLSGKGILFDREILINILSRLTGKPLGHYRLDFVVDKKVIIEIKAMKFTPEKIQNQLYSYLYSTPYEVGYLVNFGSTRLYLKRVILTNDHKQFR